MTANECVTKAAAFLAIVTLAGNQCFKRLLIN